MLKEFLLQDAPEAIQSILTDDFDFTAQESVGYLVANRSGAAQIYAREIDLFLARSRSDPKTQAKILRILYEARAIAFDRADLDRKIDYDHKICHYHEKVGDSCALCAQACPEGAIVKDEETHRLKYAADLCSSCAKCVGVCPTGAIELGALGSFAFEKIARLYEGLIPLIVDEKTIENLEACSLPSGVAPFVVPNGDMLSETALLTLLQESGSQIVTACEISAQAQRVLNDVWGAIYGKKAILTIGEIDAAQPIVSSDYAADLSGLNARAVFATRLRRAVGDRDFGIVESDRFGAIEVDWDRCSLCAACAQNCVSAALSADETEGVLRACDALCSLCGECGAICPEKAIAIKGGAIALNPSWFAQRVVAKDEAFFCVECGKPFATSKSIAKTIAVIAPLFAGDEAKIRSLSCCAECKPKVMIKAMLEYKNA
ncbi:MAG: 4Fe-4S dicluster domain-containing protein [Helicobacteraceae bacterium]|nr:4Fe-4S dicluster domain-containing protein [Helicobacteraceae bacterium]